MKQITLLFTTIILSLTAFAQVPQGINYQTVVRDGDGNILPDAEISLQMTIRSNAPDGEVVYQETHDATTNAFGLVNLVIGYGVPVSNAFADINWGDGDKYLETAVDMEGGGTYAVLGVTQFLSTPYSLFASNGVQSMTTAERDALQNPPTGMAIYNTTSNCLNYFNGTSWFETCGDCTPMPTLANAGPNQYFDDETVATNLEGNTPEFGTGTWSVVSGTGGIFDDANDPTTLFTGQACETYTLKWTIENPCGSTSDTMNIQFYTQPTTADAGSDTIVFGGSLSVYLNANVPEVGEGIWTVLAGEGGIFDDATNPQALFAGLPYVDYTLQWSIATACDTTYDEVMMAFYPYCGMTFADPRDGQSYETVQIGGQCWMAQNLAYLPEVNPSSQGDNTNPYYYVYDYQGTDVIEAKATENYQNYGTLYNWPSSQSACPTGWHLPSDADWTVLIDFLGGSIVAGGKMKSTRTAPNQHPRWDNPNIDATNSSGFSGLPGGTRHTIGGFYNMGSDGYFWSSTEASTTDAWLHSMWYGSGDTYRYGYPKSLGFSVRCLRD